MKQHKKIFLLIDGDSMLFKAFFAMYRVAHKFKAPSGLHTNAIYGFNNMFNKLLHRYHPKYVLVAWDAGSTTFRTKMFPDYKGNRKKTSSILKEQFKPCMQLVSAYGGKNYELKNYEADDIVGTMAHKADKEGLHTIIITGDRDYTQLCSNNSTVFISKRGVTHMQKLTPKKLKEDLGLTPQQIVDKKALQGDSSDNYPGVRKVGSKTADKLVKKFGSVEGIYKHIKEIKAKALHKHLVQDKLIAFQAKKLAQIKLNTPVTISLNTCKFNGIDKKQLKNECKELGFKRMLSNLR